MKQHIIPKEEESLQDAVPEEEEMVMLIPNEGFEEDPVDEPPNIPPTSQEVANVDMNGENQENLMETLNNFIMAISSSMVTISNRIIHKIEFLSEHGIDWNDVLDEDPEDM